MKRYAYCWVLVLALLAEGAVRAEDAKPEDKPKTDAAKPDDKPKKEEAKPDAAKPPEVNPIEEARVGTLGDKPANAAADVVAVLKVSTDTGAKQGKGGGGKHAGGGKHGGGAATPTETTFNLSATGDVATKLADLAKRSAYVQVSGVVTGDTIKVSAVFETERTVAGGGKKGKKNK